MPITNAEARQIIALSAAVEDALSKHHAAVAKLSEFVFDQLRQESAAAPSDANMLDAKQPGEATDPSHYSGMIRAGQSLGLHIKCKHCGHREYQADREERCRKCGMFSPWVWAYDPGTPSDYQGLPVLPRNCFMTGQCDICFYKGFTPEDLKSTVCPACRDHRWTVRRQCVCGSLITPENGKCRVCGIDR